MKEALELFVKSLVDDQDAVSISETINNNMTVLEVKVAEGDMGKVIGKQGRLARAIRILVKSIAAKEGKKVSIEFIG